jgi:hypothetical protein
LQRLLSAEDHLLGDFHHAAFASVLDHLGVEQVRRGLQSWLGEASSCAFALRLHPLAEGFQDRFTILGPLVAEEDVEGAIVDFLGPFDQLVRLLLADLSRDKGGYDLVHRVEAHPDPVVAILGLELLQGCAVRFLFLTKLQNSSNCASSKWRLTIR